MNRIENLFGTNKPSNIIDSITKEVTSNNVPYIANKLSLYAVIGLNSKDKARVKKRSITEALKKKIKRTTNKDVKKLLEDVLDLLILFTESIIESFNAGREYKVVTPPIIDLNSSKSFVELKKVYDNAENEELKAVATIVILMLSTGETIKNLYKFKEFQNQVKNGFSDDELFNMLNHFKSVFGDVPNRSVNERVARRIVNVLGAKHNFSHLVKIGQFNVLSVNYKYE